MRTLSDLEKEVRVLRSKVRKLEHGGAAAHDHAVDELVGTNDGDYGLGLVGGGGRFSQEVARSSRSMGEQQLAAAAHELSLNPAACETRAAEIAFRKRFSFAPSSELDRLIVSARENL